jgi:2'-5' RNA ligase
LRAFVGIPLPGSFSDWLQTRRTIFASILPKLILVPVSSCHITLRFLGEVPSEGVADAIERLTRSLSVMPATTVVLDRFGVFLRDGHPGVLWTGPSVVPQALMGLAAKTDLCMSGVGSNGRTERFVPHVTLGRFAPGTRDEDVAAIDEAEAAEPYAVSVTNVVLYESIMGQGHPVYVARASVRLAPFAE